MFDRKTNIFTANNGTQLKIKKIRAFKVQILNLNIQKKYKEQKEPIDPPFFFVKLASGGQQRHYHSAETIYKKNEKGELTKQYRDDLAPEVVREWEIHLDAVSRMEEEVAYSSMMLILQDGIEPFEIQDYEWEENQRELGFEIPENIKAKKRSLSDYGSFRR